MLRRTTLLLSSLLLSTAALASGVSITATGTGTTQVQARIAAEFHAQVQCVSLGMGTLSIQFLHAVRMGGGWLATVQAECGEADGPPVIHH